MANPVNIRGLQPVSFVSGSPYNGATRQYAHDSGNAVSVFPGDLVTQTGSSSTINGKTMMNVVQGATGDVFTGVVVSVEPDTRDSLTYCAASTTRILNVCDDPNVMFQVSDANSGTPLTANDLGLNINVVVGSGSTITGYSGMALDNSTEAVTNTLDLKIMGVPNQPNNDIGSAAAQYLVRINRHRLVNQVAGL